MRPLRTTDDYATDRKNFIACGDNASTARLTFGQAVCARSQKDSGRRFTFAKNSRRRHCSEKFKTR
ncbi:MAG: hypothetical protein ACLUSP_01905 [Christensenellales bacterium]